LSLAETLGKTLDEILSLSVMELRVWAAHFRLKEKETNGRS